jgi:hypothetical protein
MDEEQERTVGLLLLGKGAVLAHGFDRPLAAGMDEYEQRPARDTGRDARCSFDKRVSSPRHHLREIQRLLFVAAEADRARRNP